MLTELCAALTGESPRAQLRDPSYLREAEHLVSEVYRVLGPGHPPLPGCSGGADVHRVGLRIGEEADRDGQYFHYMSVWIFALWRLSEAEPGFGHYHDRARQLAVDLHARFFVPERGIWWKMKEDLSGPAQGKIYAISRSGCITYMCTHRSHTYMM